jgi:hypothetical protein
MFGGMLTVGVTRVPFYDPAILREQILLQPHGFTLSLALHDWEPVGTIFAHSLCGELLWTGRSN